MRNTFRHIPFVRLLFPLIIGIFIKEYFALPSFLQYAIFVLFPCLVFMAFRKQKRNQVYFGVLTSIFLILLGISLVQWQLKDTHSQYFSHFINKKGNTEWVGVIQDMPIIKEKNVEAIVSIKTIFQGGKQQTVRGNIKTYFKKDIQSKRLQYGDEVRIRSSIQAAQTPKNPKAFNFANYLKYQGIYYTSFVKKGHFLFLQNSPPSRLMQQSYAFKETALSALDKHLDTENERAVGHALILGFKGRMTDEVKNAYASTGATHVLAVSGLHVGILYLVIKFLFGFIKSKKAWLKWVKLLVSLVFIWGFALITGMSPSVQRAATMFSFVAVGDVLSRNKNIYNTLAASAFFLLCSNPYLLFSAGFQLSYLAVVGIVFFQPLIYRSWYVKGKFGQKIWELMSVSLAAQIVTLPISLYYFHQFPTYFLLSGLVVIPAASFIMGFGLSIIVLEYFGMASWLVDVLGYALHTIIWVVNSVIFFMSKMPFHPIENIYISTSETILCYLGIIALMAWIGTGKKWLLYSFFGILIIVGMSTNLRFFQHQQRQEWVMYDSPTLLIDYFKNGKRVSFHSPTLTPKQEHFASKAFRTYMGNSPSENVLQHKDFILLGDKKFYILQDDFKGISSAVPISVDGIIIQNNPFIRFEDLEKAFTFDCIVADGSNRSSLVKKWRTYYKGEKPFYYTKDGAVRIEF